MLCALALIAYANTLGHPFVYDDSDIARSPLLHDPWNLPAICNGDFYGPRKLEYQLYRPLADWGYVVNVRLNELVFGDGMSPVGFHVLDIALHAAVACVLLVWLRRLKLAPEAAFIAAVLFVVHPLHTENVANTINRSDVQAALFGLVFLLLHARRVPVLPALVYLCAMWSKESAAMFFPLAVAADALCPERIESSSAAGARSAPRDRVRRWKRWPLADYALLAGAFAVWMWMRSMALRGIPEAPAPIDNPLQVVSVGERVLTALAVQGHYLRLLVAPIGLSSDYSFRAIPIARSLAEPRVLVSAVVILAVVVAGWRLRRSRPVVALAIAGYAILFATTSNFVITIGTIMAERLVYMPSILFCALVGIGAWELASVVGRRTIAIALTVVACVLIGLTFARNRTWSDNLTFSREQVRTAPESAKAHVNLASALGNIGDDRGAASEYERALEILPTYPKIHYQLGNARHRLNADPETVVDAYRHAIEDDPADVDARANLAWTLIDLGRLDAARASVNELRALAPNHELLPKLSKRLAQKQKRENPPLR